MKISCYNGQGEEIKLECDPCYKWRNNPKKDRPKDFVMVKQLESVETITDPFGEIQELKKLSKPVEEVYYGWVWENGSWNCLIRMVVQKDVIVLDRRPVGWKFFEKFQANKPRSLQ